MARRAAPCRHHPAAPPPVASSTTVPAPAQSPLHSHHLTEMVGERKNKGKELVGARHKLLVTTPTLCTIDNDCTKPPSPTPIEFSPTSDSSTQPPSDVNADIETPVIIKTNIGGGDRIFIHPRGQEFTYQTKCASLIEEIIELKFNEPWKSFKNVPLDVKDTWFGEFEKEFSWREEDRCQIRKIFEIVCSNVMKNRLFEAKKSNKRPLWISQRTWNALQEEWGREQDKKVWEQNKKNRASDCDGQNYPKHVGGSITHLTQVNRLEARSTKEGGSDVPPLFTQIEIWTEMVGGSKKGRVSGLGGMGHKDYLAQIRVGKVNKRTNS